MNNDRDTIRDTDRNDQDMRDRNITDDMQNPRQGGMPTQQRSKTERGEIESNEDLDEDVDDDMTE